MFAAQPLLTRLGDSYWLGKAALEELEHSVLQFLAVADVPVEVAIHLSSRLAANARVEWFVELLGLVEQSLLSTEQAVHLGDHVWLYEDMLADAVERVHSALVGTGRGLTPRDAARKAFERLPKYVRQRLLQGALARALYADQRFIYIAGTRQWHALRIQAREGNDTAVLILQKALLPTAYLDLALAVSRSGTPSTLDLESDPRFSL